jgi:hypothetical protein
MSEHQVNVVAQVFCAVSVNLCPLYMDNFGDADAKCKEDVKYIEYKDVKIKLGTIFNKNKVKFCSMNLEYYKNILKPLSLIDLRCVLHLLIPYATNSYGGSKDVVYVNTLPHVEATIKFINEEIAMIMYSDKGMFDIINDNKMLKNKCETLSNNNKELETKCDKLINEVTELEYKCNEYSTSIKNYNNTVSMLMDEVEVLESECEELKKKNSNALIMLSQ